MMQSFKVLFFLLISLLLTTVALADKLEKSPASFPHGCRTIGYEFKNNLLLLKPVSDTSNITTLYLIHNLSNYPISLAVVKLPTQPFSPAYENTISTNQWAAFALNQPILQLSCTSNNILVNCQNALELCQYNRAKFAEHNQGTYWIIRDSKKQEAIRASINDGILLRW